MIWSLSLHQGGKKSHKNRTSHATTLCMHSGNSKRKMERFLSTSWFRVMRDTTWTLLQIAPLYFLLYLPSTTLLSSFSLWRREMLKRSALKSVPMTRFAINSADHQISFHTPPLTENYLCFRSFLLCSNKRLVFPIRVDCALSLAFSKIVEPKSQMTIEHSALKVRVTNTAGVRDTEKPLGINLHMVSPEIHPGLHCLELTSLHQSVDN